MQIFIVPGAPDCSNLGDLAMLQVAIGRLHTLWPDATLRVLTRHPATLCECCPGVEPVPWNGCKHWLRIRSLPRRLFPEVRAERRNAWPLSPTRCWRLGLLCWPGRLEPAREFAAALFNSDLAILAGCGLVADAFARQALQVLNILAVAQRCGIPTALLSQGIGPITSAALLRRAGEVLPQARRILLREQRRSLSLVRRLSVPESIIRVTGDDTVELAFRARRADSGRHIGVNLRRASYAALDAAVFPIVRRELSKLANRHETTLLGLPILCGGKSPDARVVAELFAGLPCAGDAGTALHTPAEVVRRIADCRIVVTGSYHAGVFALSQGIPVVALAGSAYYQDKFLGLAGQFGAGCRVLPTSGPEFARQLEQAAAELWEQSPALRAPLWRAAEEQIQASRTAYSDLPGALLPPQSSATKPQPNPSVSAA
jgi:colanic acid/amylovoran biosynthesis protein